MGAAGAAVCSVVPIIGTAIGRVVGAIAGGWKEILWKGTF